ncbi:unnamed protein product, partial [Prorocentrum cordatum]
AEGARSGKLWNSKLQLPESGGLPIEQLEGIGPLYSEDLIAVSESYAPGAASCVDGSHMRNFFLVQPELSAACATFHATVRAGLTPHQTQAIIALPLAKPAGRCRPIGLFFVFYRLRARARRPCAQRWEAGNQRTHLA